MSSENVEIVRRAYEALNAGDMEGVAAAFSPDIELIMAKEAGTVLGLDFDERYTGVAGFGRFLSQVADALDDVRWEPEQIIDAGGDQVVVFVRMSATGRGSGIELDQRMAHLCTVREGLLVRHETFWDRDAARAAAGLADSPE